MALVDDVRLEFRVNGELRTLEYRKVTFGTWADLKKMLGFTPSTLLRGVGDGDVEALGALIWLERRQRERDLNWMSVRRELEREEHSLEPLRAVVNGEVVFDVGDIAADTSSSEDEPDPTSA